MALQHIIPMTSLILTAPFATKYPPLLDATVRAVEAVVVNVWPRIDYYRMNILDGLVGCWCKILNEEVTSSNNVLIRVKSHIEKVVRLMTALLKTQRNIKDDYHHLIAIDGRLKDLLFT